MNKATAPRFPCLAGLRGETAYSLAFEFPRFTSRNKPDAFRIRNYRPKGNAKNISPGSSGIKHPPLAGCRLSSLQWADMAFPLSTSSPTALAASSPTWFQSEATTILTLPVLAASSPAWFQSGCYNHSHPSRNRYHISAHRIFLVQKRPGFPVSSYPLIPTSAKGNRASAKLPKITYESARIARQTKCKFL